MKFFVTVGFEVEAETSRQAGVSIQFALVDGVLAKNNIISAKVLSTQQISPPANNSGAN